MNIPKLSFTLRAATFALAATALFTPAMRADVVIYNFKVTISEVGKLVIDYYYDEDLQDYVEVYGPSSNKMTYTQYLVVDKTTGGGYVLDYWTAKEGGKTVKYYYVNEKYDTENFAAIDGGKPSKQFEAYGQAIGLKSTVTLASGTKLKLAKALSGVSSFTNWYEYDENTGAPIPESGAYFRTDLYKLTMDVPLTAKVWDKPVEDALGDLLEALEKKKFTEYVYEE